MTNVERSGPRTGPTWEQMFARARLGWAQLGSVGLGAARLDSARFGPVRLGSARSGSAQLGLVRFGSVRLGAAFVGRVNVVASNMLVAGICLFSENRNKDLPHVRKPIRMCLRKAPMVFVCILVCCFRTRLKPWNETW